MKTINAIALEHLRKGKNIVHSFLLIMVTASTKDDISYTDIEKENSIIKSDYILIKKFLNSEIFIPEINSKLIG